MSYLWAEEDCNGSPSGLFRERYFVLFPLCGLRWYAENPNPQPPLSSAPGGAGAAGAAADSVFSAALPMRPTDSGHSGWVFGGGIVLASCRAEGEVLHQAADVTHSAASPDRDPSQALDASALQMQMQIDTRDDAYADGLAAGGFEGSTELHPFVVMLGSDEGATTTVRLAACTAADCAAWVRRINEFASVQNYLVACHERCVIVFLCLYLYMFLRARVALFPFPC